MHAGGAISGFGFFAGQFSDSHTVKICLPLNEGTPTLGIYFIEILTHGHKIQVPAWDILSSITSNNQQCLPTRSVVVVGGGCSNQFSSIHVLETHAAIRNVSRVNMGHLSLTAKLRKGTICGVC